MIKRFLLLLKTLLFYKFLFKRIGTKTVVLSVLKLEGPNNISLGNRVYIGHKVWLGAVPHTGEVMCELIIKDGAVIGNFNHIYSTKKIVIEKNVLTADRVYISDNIHGYLDINVPIMRQPIIQKAEVKIGEGSWIGENACVIGASVGKNCVIGANSVVTRDIPDYCVAVGSPAKIIKRYDIQTKCWVKHDS